LDWATRIETEPLYQVNSLHIRMLYHLWQGDMREAMRCKQQVDVLRIQRSAQQFFEGTHLLWQITAHAIAHDLTRTKQTIEEIDALCRRYPGWIPVRYYGLAEYHRIRGDLASALSAIASGLALTSAGEHQIWPYLAGAHLRTLHDLKRDDEALELGEEYSAAAEQADLGYLKNYVWMPLSLVQARVGRADDAVALSERVVQNFRALGSTGLNLGLAYETRARVALLLRDLDAFDEYATLFKGTVQATSNPTLAARSEKLSREAQDFAGRALPSGRWDRDERVTNSRALSMLETCHNATERAQCALSWLAQASGVTDGYLFLMSGQGPSCVAQLGIRPLPGAVSALAEDYLSAQTRECDTTTDSTAESTGQFSLQWEGGNDTQVYRPVLLSHPVRTGMAITGVVVLAIPRDTHFVHPARLATELSRRIAQSGDVSSLVVAS
jgi:hypothetical protein